MASLKRLISKHGPCVQCRRYVLTPYKLWCGIKCQIAWEARRGK